MAQVGANHLRSNASGFNDVVVHQNSGGTENGKLCRAFVQFNGNNGTINHSFNVTSVTNNGLGDFTITFTNTASTASFASAINASGEGEYGRSYNKTTGYLSSTTTTLRLNTRASGPNGGIGETYGIDYLNISAVIFY